MDVGNPSNFVRMLELYDHDYTAIEKDVKGFYCDDATIAANISQVQLNNHYTLDPHGAVGYEALKKMKAATEVGIFLETAHPAKFLEVVEPLIKTKIILPATLEKFVGREVLTDKMSNDYEALKEKLLAHN
jgi:threonine synthase